MLMTFADMTLGQAVWDLTENAPSVTLNMQTQFLKPAKAGDLVEVQPELIRRTRALLFMRGDYKVNSETIFTASSVWKLLGVD
jgi:acyl-coenzyme A thioesterase PaaI-like protein